MISKKDLAEYVDMTTAASMLGVSTGRVSKLCTGGRIKGAFKFGGSWFIPKEGIEKFERLPRGVKPQKSMKAVFAEFREAVKKVGSSAM